MAEVDVAMKRCGCCWTEKLLTEFHKDRSKRQGVASSCKSCAVERASRWYEEHKEVALRSSARYYAEHRDLLIRQMAIRRRENLEAYSAIEKRWRLANSERKIANDKRWREANAGKVRVYRQVSEARRKASRGRSSGHFTAEQVQAMRRLQRFKCPICQGSIRRKFHIDHVVPLARGGTNEVSNIQLLCPTCNIRKQAKDPIRHMQELGFLI